jgi:N-acetylmuramoyl-L-alanine amidase
LHRPAAAAVWLAGLLLALSWLAATAAARSAPNRPDATVRLGGVEYVDAAGFGARFGLDPALTGSGRTLTLKSAWTKIVFDADSRECEVNGLRVFLGDAVRIHRGRIMLSRLDAEKLITPVLLPGSGENHVPELKLIVIDPGHGGSDPGKENRRLKINEKTMALDTARRLQKVLQADGYRVLLTRSDDRQLGPDKVSDLLRRDEIANKAGADLFISLHYNAVESGANRVTGVEVYTLTPQNQYSTSDPEHEDDRGAAEANTGNRNDHWNTVLGYQVHRNMIDELRASDRGLKRARWAVLRHVECPAILVESGFLSNDAEARRIATPAYRQKIAEAIADGVQAYGNILAGVRRQRAGH